jgi:conflict system pore-forming effector with SLATT domain/uncharacterized protein DUF4231
VVDSNVASPTPEPGAGPSTAGSAPATTIPDEQLKSIVESAWQDQARWSLTASRLKRRLGLWRAVGAIGGVTGAALATIAAALPDQGSGSELRLPLGAAGAVVLALTAGILRTQVSQERIQAWIRTRSVSEAIKEEIYRFLVGATPYLGGRDVALFENNLETSKAGDQGLNREVAAVGAPSVSNRPLGLFSVDDYITKRVNGQIDGYYYPKAKQNADRGNLFRNAEFALGLLAAVLGALAATEVIVPGLGFGVAIVTTATGAVTAYLAAGRYDYQAISYYGTADRLKALRNGFVGSPRTPEAISDFVDRCEQAISSENEAWLATWKKEEDKPDAA